MALGGREVSLGSPAQLRRQSSLWSSDVNDSERASSGTCVEARYKLDDGHWGSGSLREVQEHNNLLIHSIRRVGSA